jgi:hypothetical protein
MKEPIQMRMPFAAALFAVSLLAGCSGGPDRTDGAETPSSVSAQNDCGAAAEKIRQHLKTSEVDKVVVEGQCTSAVVKTTLGDEASEAARQLCEAAAEVAYVGDINAVTVLGRTGRELAIGITGMKCLASH